MPTTTRSRKQRKVTDDSEKDLKEWSEGLLSDSEMLDRWFKTDNYSGTRFNALGFWACDCTGVDWDDFEHALDKYPNLAFILEEGDYSRYVPIIFHCYSSHDPPVPVSVVKKLITINPSLLYSDHVAEDIDPTEKPIGYSVLQDYLVRPYWKTSFDVCRVLVEAEPELLLYRTKDPWCGWGATGRETLLGFFPKEGKELCNRLEASGKVDCSAENIRAVNERRFNNMYPDMSDYDNDDDEEQESPRHPT